MLSEKGRSLAQFRAVQSDSDSDFPVTDSDEASTTTGMHLLTGSYMRNEGKS